MSALRRSLRRFGTLQQKKGPLFDRLEGSMQHGSVLRPHFAPFHFFNHWSMRPQLHRRRADGGIV